MTATMIEEMKPDDWPSVRRIYREGIATGDATLEIDAPAWDAWDAAHRPDCRLVARREGMVVGWAALSPFSARQVYRGVAWESVYVAQGARGAGIGRVLLEAIVAASETSGVWTLLAGVIADNRASLVVHERAGFRRVGVQEKIGQDRADKWRDVVLLERRSRAVGWPPVDQKTT